jgi:signal transduction histidine kinase
MLRRLNVSTKVRAVLAVPMVVLIVAGAFITWTAYQSLRYARANGAVLTVLLESAPLANAVRVEASASQAGSTTAAQLTSDRAATDKAAATVLAAAKKVDTSQLTSGSRAAFESLLRSVTTTLPSARAQVDNGNGLVSSTFESIFTAQSGFAATYSNDLTDRTLATQVGAHSQILSYTAALSTEQQAGLNLLADPASVVANSRYVTTRAQTDQSAKLAATAVDDIGLNGDSLRSFDSVAGKLRSDLANGDAAVLAATPKDTWTTAVTNQFAAASKVDATVLDKANSTAAVAERDALVQLAITFFVILAAALASWLLASLVARSIVRPLRRLTDTAGQVREQLPRLVEQVAVPGEGPDIELPRIAVESDDEIGRLATAFNDVNATTIQVAQEQAALRGSIAEMFVNVARRDQVLLNRQLAFVDSLERSEEDPVVLANLFHLDHLATRMRRNAESLLVLAGIDSGRRLRESMPLSDVIRTASSEIEQYDRVELDLTVDPLMLGFNALPAAHMLAELLENASVFSEPDTPVEVATGMSGQFVTVSVLDHGIGMTDSELTAVNEKLQSTAPGDALGAQRLGLFVVARLARRLSAQVSVRHAPGGPGTETIVSFPVALFAGLDSEPLQGSAPAAVPAPALSADVEALIEAQEVPEVRAVDLSALTDGATDQGLPRRRQGVVPDDLDSGAFVLPPTVNPAEVSTELTGTADGWSPMIVSSAVSGLPTRRRDGDAAEAPEVPLLDLSPVKPVDPEERKGLFTGFRGWSRQQDETVSAEGAGLAAEAATPQAGQRSVDAPSTESTATQSAAGTADPVVPRPRTRRGAHAAPSAEPAADLPFGYSSDEVASWHTGSIPVVSSGDGEGDWPSPTWDTAAWQPAGLFSRPGSGDDLPAPTFEPIALEPDDDEPAWEPVVLAPAEDLGLDGGDAPWSAAIEQDAPAWQPVMDLSETPLGGTGRAASADQPAAPEEPVWSPVMDLSDAPLVPAAAPDEPVWSPVMDLSDAPLVPAAAPDEPVWSPVMDLSDAPLVPAPAPAEPAADWNAPAWPAAVPTQASDEPTQPVPSAPALPLASASPAAPVEELAPTAWPAVSGPGAQQSVASVAEPGRKRRFGLFGRKAKAEEAPVQPMSAAPAPVVPTVPAPTWGTPEAAEPVVPAPAEPVWSAPTGWAPTAEPQPAPKAEPAWGATPSFGEPVGPAISRPAVPAAAGAGPWGALDAGAPVAPGGRDGTLDDDVAAMLALRSDIEEQALSELSQLSAYRPSMGGSAERLTRRVPTAVPAAEPSAGNHPIRRDADELRSRLASFQSGTTRGRRAPVDSEGSGS